MGESILGNPEIAASARDEARTPDEKLRNYGSIEFIALLGLGIAAWFVCAPVLPLPSNAHLRAFLIASGEMLFLVGVGCRAARLPRLAPTALRRLLERREPQLRTIELLYAAIGAAAVSILGTRVLQAIVVKATWSPALAAKAPTAVKEAGRKAFELFRSHPIAVGIGFPVIEEIHFRLFPLTALAWTIARLRRAPAEKLGARGWWAAIAIQALMFGAIHAATGEGTLWWEPRGVQMMLEPRAFAGVVLGYVYWRWGLETSILAHVIADLSVLGYRMPHAPPA